MKLISCYVYAFGKLKDYSYDFSDGLNEIKEDNGWGKSTFAAFIKSMFYGLNDSKRTVGENERKKFAPWNSNEKFGGNVVFLWKDRRFKIERFFGSKESEDTVRLTDFDSGKEFPNNKNLGERIFNIDEEGFTFTTYLSQKEVEAKSNSSLTSKYNSVCEVQDSAAYDKAVKILEDKSKEYYIRGGKGKIEDKKRQIRDVENRTENALAAAETVNALKSSLSEVSLENKNLTEKLKDISSRYERAGKKEAACERKKRHDVLASREKEYSEKKKAAEMVLRGFSFGKKDADSVAECITELEKLSAKEEMIEADIKDFSAKGPQENKVFNFIPFLIIFAILTAAGIGLLFVNVVLGIVIAVLGAISLIWFASKYRKTKISGKVYQTFSMALKEKENRLSVVKEQKQNYVVALDKFFSKFDVPSGLNYKDKAEYLKSAQMQLDSAICESDRIKKEMEELEALGLGENSLDENLADLKAEHQRLNGELTKNIGKEEQLKSRIKILQEQYDSIIDLENEKAQLTDEKHELEREYKIITETLEFLKLADENLKSKYSSPLKDNLNKYLDMLGGGVSAVIDTDFKITVEEKGAERESAFFSKGYRTMFEICKRFALIDVLFKDEKPFMILDDPFTDLDDEKVKKSLNLLKTLSEEYQVLYLVCHDSRAV